MINTKIKKLGLKIFLIFWNICAIIGLLVTGYFLYLVFDAEGHCLSEEHGVWDSKQRICRQDCVKFDDNLGCITKEHLEEYLKSQRSI